MVTRHYKPNELKVPEEAPKSTRHYRKPFWLDPDTYFPSKSGKKEFNSDSIQVTEDQPLQVLFAGHVGAKGFPDPRVLTKKDLVDHLVSRDICSPTAEDIKRDLRRLDFITKESVDDVIAHYMEDGAESPSPPVKSSQARFKEPPSFPRPHWTANEPPRHSGNTEIASPPSKVVAIRPKRKQDPALEPCPCCADVNAENARRRDDVNYTYSPSSMRIEYPGPNMSNLSISSPGYDSVPMIDTGDPLSKQPLSQIIRADPANRQLAKMGSDDLFVVYDNQKTRAGWVPLEEVHRFRPRRGGRIMYGANGIAYIDYEYPQAQVTLSEDPAIDEQRRRLEMDVLHSYGKYQSSMDRLGNQIDDLKDWRYGPPRDHVSFPPPKTSALPPPIHVTPPTSQRNVRFSNDSPLKFIYSPQSTPQAGATR